MSATILPLPRSDAAVAATLLREAREYQQQTREYHRLGRYNTAIAARTAIHGIAVQLLLSELAPDTWLAELQTILREVGEWQ